MKHIQAIDISAKMIEIEQGKADANDVENITFKRSIIGEFSVPDQTLTPCWGSVSCSFWISSNAGFEIDYQTQPGKGKAVFIVAKKAE